jgi:glycosyltransferase involved in cell wall biosynthesis
MISFIVPAHNEERLLGRTLVAIHDAAAGIGQPYEVIVVDDASEDLTSAVAAQHGARIERVEYRQISRTRNAGARIASGDPLIFVDADTVISSRVLHGTLEAIQRGAVGGGARLIVDGWIPLYGRMLLTITGLVMRTADLIAGCYFFCTRAAFDAAGGFDESVYAAEELVLSRRLARIGWIAILDAPVVTSGRKLREHSGWDVVRLLGALVRRGPAVVRTRDDLALWYGKRRNDGDRDA